MTRSTGVWHHLLWVLGFDDRAVDRYNDPPSPLSRAFLAACAAERDSRSPADSPGDQPSRQSRGTLLPSQQPS